MWALVPTLAVAQPQDQPARIEVPFNFGWRYRYAEDAAVPPACSDPSEPSTGFAEFRSGIACQQVFEDDNSQSLEDCKAACCGDPSCGLYLYTNDNTIPSHAPKGNFTAHCWRGHSVNTQGCSNEHNWVGGMRNVTVAKPAPRLQPRSTAPAAIDYDHSEWDQVDLPHDFKITQEYGDNLGRGQAYLPFNVSWYRKSFAVPEEWQGEKAIYVKIKGAQRSARVFLNGAEIAFHPLAYTEFVVRLDTATATVASPSSPDATASLLRYGAGRKNILAVFVDATFSSFDGMGWWYEGGGLTRGAEMIALPLAVHFDLHGAGVFPVASLPPAASAAASIHPHAAGDGSEGLWSDAIDLTINATLVKAASGGSGGGGGSIGSTHLHMCVKLIDTGGNVVIEPAPVPLPPNPEHQDVQITVTVPKAELWSIPRPYLYTLVVSIVQSEATNSTATDAAITATATTTVLDEVSMPVGLKVGNFTELQGYELNGERVRIKGFCLHDNFAGVGVAVPDRINLFRAQSLRGVGGNGWRMSHNPGSQATLSILDVLGVLVWDENREFDTDSSHVDGMAAMVQQGRHHPSVIIWSVCNEGHCQSYDATSNDNGLDRNRTIDGVAAGTLYKAVTRMLDPSRPMTGNMETFGPGLLSEVLDVQSFSHSGGTSIPRYRKAGYTKPAMEGECCSCRTVRGTPFNGTDGSADRKFDSWTDFNAECMAAETNSSMSLRMNPGTFVWTLFDYYGEPSFGGFPEVSSSFGAFDLAGFDKAGAHWFRSWWLGTPDCYDAGDDPEADRPPLPHGTVLKIGNDMQPRPRGTPSVAFVYTNAPVVELFLNGKSLGHQAVKRLGYASWTFPYERGNLTAVALSPGGTGAGSQVGHHHDPSSGSEAAASDTVVTAGPATQLRLTVDVPSVSTGTGDRLLADGADAGLVRVTLLDAAGNVAPDSGVNVSFSIVDGPGRVIGVGNGNPKCVEPNQVPWRSSFRGLVRAVVQVDTTCPPGWLRSLLERIDLEGGHRTQICTGNSFSDAAGSSSVPSLNSSWKNITVEAAAPGFEPQRIQIPVSVDSSTDSVLAAAAQSITRANLGGVF